MHDATLVVGLIQMAVLVPLTLAIGLPGQWVSVGMQALIAALVTLHAVASAVGYHDLRVAKEGVGIDELGAVSE